MIADDDVAMFVSMTSADANEARSYLEMAGGDVERAVGLFFEMGGGGGALPSRPPVSAGAGGVVDADVAAEVAAVAAAAGIDTGPLDAVMEDVRAPIAAFQDQIINPEHEQRRMQEAIQADSAAMNRRMAFDRGQDGAGAGSGEKVAEESAAGAGRGQAINQLFAAPDYNETGTYYQTIEKGKVEGKWVLVNIQQAEVFASHALNRDVWSDDTIKDVVTGSFLFWQRDDKSHEGEQFCQYHQCGHRLPHIAVVDPRTGRQLKSWDGRKWSESTAAAEYLFCFLDEFNMSRSPPAMSPAGSPMMRPQAPPDDGKAGGMKLVGLDEAMAPAADDGEAALVADAEMSGALKDLPCEMPEEPPEGGDAVKVSMRLPDGKRIMRRFLPGDRIEVMFRVASALAQAPINLVDLSTQFPKRILRDIDGGLEASVKDAEVAGNMVMISLRAA